MSEASVIAKVSDLKVHYPLRRNGWGFGPRPTLKAVDGVSLELHRGEILGLVGESGCGKSSLGRALLRLVEPTAGQVELGGRDFLSLKGAELRRFRPRVQMIFQDPYASLDPRMTVFEVLAEPLVAHQALSRPELVDKVRSMLELVGLSTRSLKKYPHEFSGGQRQRIAIARALILGPEVIVADEPVSSLDVSVQAQILNLLKDIQQRLQLSMVFISHNLAVVKYISDRIAVMYLGKIVESATCEALFLAPRHPYTRAIISAVPIPDPKLERARARLALTGEIPSPIDPPKGCAFQGRCPMVRDRCRVEPPALIEDEKGKIACFAAE
jgi:oligopeptide/dipeptide ABC transporter ATP-binding protein